MPKRNDGKIYRRVCIMLTTETIELLESLAKLNNKTKSELVRFLIEGRDVERKENNG